MKNTRLFPTVWIVCAGLSLCACQKLRDKEVTEEPAGAQVGSAEVDEPNVLATVNGVDITDMDVDFQLRGGHGQKVTPELRQLALERLIDAELMYRHGLELGLDQDKKYQRAIRAYEMRIAAAKRNEMVRRVFNREVAAKVEVNDADAQRYFAQHKAKLAQKYHLYMMRFKEKGAADDTYDLLRKGGSFEELARKQFVHVPKMNEREPWDLGFLGWKQMPSEWAEAVFPAQGQRHHATD